MAVAALLGGAGAAVPAVAAGAPPAVGAPAAILVQPETGDVVFGRRTTQRRAIASTTKLMTVLLALERRRLSRRITAVPYPALAVESVVGLRAGERLTTADMVRALLLASANDAAAAVAADVGGSQRGFVRLMNERARRAGLRGTRFANPVGLDDPGNYSTAADLAKLALLVRRSPFAARVMDQPRAVLRSGEVTRAVANRNTLISAVPWVDGVKTGHTQAAGYVLVGAGSRGGVELVSVVLGTPGEAARDADTLALLRWGFTRYRRLTPVRAGRRLAEVPVTDQDRTIPLVARDSARVVARRGERLRTRLVGVPEEIAGPLPAGSRAGEAQVIRRGRIVSRVPLVTGGELAAASFWQRSSPGRAALAAGLLVALALAVGASLTARRHVRRREARSRTA